MKTIEFVFFFIFVLILGGISCVDEIFIEGNNDVRSEFRADSAFNQIALSGDFMVMVKPGNEYSVEVSAESNLLPVIETEVVGKTLQIKTSGMHTLLNNHPVELFITTPALVGLSMSGSGMLKTGSFASDHFKIALSGSGDIEATVVADMVDADVSGSGTILVKGTAGQSDFVVSGSGKIKSYELQQSRCEALIAGSGTLYLNAIDTVNARLLGSGMVYYINHPVIHTSKFGSGGVFAKN